MKEEGPCQVDLLEPREIIVHFRDLFNVGSLLEGGLDKHLSAFEKRLEEAGWSKENITNFKESACNWSVWEPQVPSKMQDKGDIYEWYRNRSRFRR